MESIKKQKEKELRDQGVSVNYFNTRFGAEDKLRPIYTICFYHGTERWNGPRSLRDMMDFGEETDGWKDCFQNYHMILFCAGEQSDLSGFRTELLEKLKQQIRNQEGDECNMCLAMEEMKREWQAEGEMKGKAEGIVAMGLEFGLSESDILIRLQSKLHVSRGKAEEYLDLFGRQTV